MGNYLYTYACHESEDELCRLELSSLFKKDGSSFVDGQWLVSSIGLDPGRSPFLKERLEQELTAASKEELTEQLAGLPPVKDTFKVQYIQTDTHLVYEERLKVERELGRMIQGQADMKQPQCLYGVTRLQERWVFGRLLQGTAIWLAHNAKPQHYSTALASRMARAVVNIAVPEVEGCRVIDPCCGIGTVVLEALSMGIDIVGSDINPLAVRGARMNLAHFQYPDVITRADMLELTGHYDAVIVDFPYNLCSVLTTDTLNRMLIHSKLLAGRGLFITSEEIDVAIRAAGWHITDRCTVRKRKFTRHFILCQSV